jgi:two-component system response regulator FixJ
VRGGFVGTIIKFPARFMSNPHCRVYIIDDDSSVRRSMRFVLAAAGYESRPFASGEDFLEELPHLQPGCVLLDVRMPQLNGLQVLSTMRKSGNRFPVLVITGHGDVPTAVEAMKLGADDFLEKPFVDDVLLRSLETLSARLGEDAEHDRRAAEANAKITLLTQREREVLQGLIGGYSNKEIALKLSLSVRTVESYRADLMRKLEMSSVADLVRFGLLLNLPPLD